MDEELRSLERAAAAGDEDAEGKLLLRRVRAGELSEEKLWLAAYLGNAGAICAAPDVPKAPEGLQAWLEALEPAGAEVLARVALAAAWPALPHYERLLLYDNAGRLFPRACLEAAEDWALCPCDEHRDVAAKAHAAAIDFSGSLTQSIRHPGTQTVNPPHTAAMWAALNVAAIAAGLGGDPESARRAVEHAAEAACPEHVGASYLPFAHDALREAISTELLDFALGIRDRAKATQQVRRRAQAMEDGRLTAAATPPVGWRLELSLALSQGLPDREPLDRRPQPLLRFAQGLANFPREVWVRVALAATHLCSPLMAQGRDRSLALRYTALQSAARAWTLCPCDAHKAECLALSRDEASHLPPPTLNDVSWVAVTLAGQEHKADGDAQWRERSTSLLGDVLILAGEVVGEARLHAALVREVRAWAEDDFDSVREREKDTP